MAAGSAAKTGSRSARRAHAGHLPSGGGLHGAAAASSSPAAAQQQQGTPFSFREGSPMDWSPFEAAVSTPLPDDCGAKGSAFEAAVKTPLPGAGKQPQGGLGRCRL